MKEYKLVLAVVALVSLDQGIKLGITQLCFSTNFAILYPILFFTPVRNFKLSYLGCFLPMFRELYILNILNIVVIIGSIFAYWYYRIIVGRKNQIVNVAYLLVLSGAICSFIDKNIWNGSLDYIKINHLFTFDLKDCYLTVALIIICWYEIKYNVNIFEYLKKKNKTNVKR